MKALAQKQKMYLLPGYNVSSRVKMLSTLLLHCMKTPRIQKFSYFMLYSLIIINRLQFEILSLLHCILMHPVYCVISQLLVNSSLRKSSLVR